MSLSISAFALSFALSACAPSPAGIRSPPASPGPDSGPDDGADPDDPPPDGTTSVPCPTGPGSVCDPFVVDPLPFEDARDTRDSPSSLVDRYACAPDTDESGPEWWYRITVPSPGLLHAAIDEVAGDDVDIDVHLLASPDPGDCLARDHVGVDHAVEAGTYWLVLDTWVDERGRPQAGPYVLDVSFLPLDEDACAVVATDVRMYWSSCAPSVPDCYTAGGEVYLSTPTRGPVVEEAHLVTDADGFGSGWPSSFTDRIEAHYANSEAATGFVAARTEPWAPAGEGGSEYGQSATSVPLPVEDEGWYLNMYWRDRPAPGTRMIVRNPDNGLAVVAAGGYETGPGDNSAIAGVAEEIHLALGTTHRDELEIAFAADPNLPLGPIACP